MPRTSSELGRPLAGISPVSCEAVEEYEGPRIRAFASYMAMERAAQAARFGGGSVERLDREDDLRNGPTNWTLRVIECAVLWAPTRELPPYGPAHLPIMMRAAVRVATLAYAFHSWAMRRAAEADRAKRMKRPKENGAQL